MNVVADILDDVRRNGDAAVRRYAKKYDGAVPARIEVGRDEINDARKNVNPGIVKTFEDVIRNVRKFSEKQMSQYKPFEYTHRGVTLGQKVVPIDIVGIYAPGGNYPLPSTAIMCAVPAKTAGVSDVILCSPNVTPEMMVASDMAGIDRIFRIGGVQAIGAMAYGTRTVPKVDKIVGPGNVYVTEAKRQVFGDVGIDFIAGPSELLIIADKDADASFIAWDMVAQAEHDMKAKVTLLTDSDTIAGNVRAEIGKIIPTLSNPEIATKSLRSMDIRNVGSLEEAVRISNDAAPEHLEIQTENAERLVDKLRNYGSLFIGGYSATVFGDYCSGTNHVLPTGGSSRYTGGLGVREFLKIQTYQKVTERGAERLSRLAEDMASVEGMEAHGKSAMARRRC